MIKIKNLLTKYKDIIESNKQVKEFIESLCELYNDDMWKHNENIKYVKNHPPIIYKDEEDNTITFEWIFSDKRAYVSFESNPDESSYGFVMNDNKSHKYLSYSNLISNTISYVQLSSFILNFVINNKMCKIY